MAKRKPRAASFALAVKDSSEPPSPERKRFKTDRDALTGVDPIIAEARKRWNRCDESEDAQRKSILEAKRFRAGDQWPDAIKIQRQGSSAIQGMAAQPARPCLTIDRLSQPIRQLSNQIKQAAFSIDVLPNGFGADTATAEIIQGYLRRVQNQARAESPIEWAADGAIEGGIGWFRLLTDYVYERWDGDPADPEAYDQELRLARITNNLTVYCDPSAVKPTRSDALFMFVTEDLDRDDFRTRWRDASLDSLDAFAATGDMPDWASQDTIRIAEYWRVRFEDQRITGPNGLTRVVRKPIVEGFKITATEVLERWEWLGSRIPLIPILGEELNIDGRPVLRGITQEGMDAQRMVNYTYSGAMEVFALAPKSPFVAAAGQIDPYLDMWKTANTFNYAYLPYEPIAIGGQTLPPPQRNNSEPPIQAAVALMLKSEEAIKATTGVYDPSLEYNNPREHSGKAIQSLQAQSDVAGSNYPMHVQRALIYAGELMVEIIPKITRPGQILQILGADDEPEQVMVGQPFQKGQDGQPVPSATHQPDLTDFYDLKKGKYAVTVTVGKGSATRREEGAAALAELIPHLPPEMAAVATPDYVEQLSFPGAHKIAEKLKKALPPQLQEQEEGGPDPEKQAMQQQIQQLQQALEGKKAEEMAKQQADLQREQIKAQTSLQQTQMEIASRERIALIQTSATLATAQAKIDAEDARTYVDAIETRVGKALELHMAKLGQAHEQIQQARDQAHDVGLTSMEQAHERDMADRQATVAAGQMAAQQAHDAEMAQQQPTDGEA